MAIYFALAIFIYIYGKLYHANRTLRRRKVYLIITFGILILVAGLRNPSVGIDLAGHYATRYNMIASYGWSQVPAFSALTGYEVGYCYYTKLLNVFVGGVQFFVFITSLLIYLAFAYFIYKESKDVILSTEIMLFSSLYYMCMNIMRQGLAMAIVIVAYVWLDYSDRKLKDYIKFGLLVLLSATFHNSAILCLIMILFDRLKFTRKQIFIGISAMAVSYLFYINIYTAVLGLFVTDNNYERYLTSATESVGNMNMQTIYNFGLAFFALLLGYYVLVWKRKSVKGLWKSQSNEYRLERNESFMLFMVLIASTFRLMVFRMNIINRMSYYFIPFILVLYPYSINSIKLKANRQIIRFAVYGLFIIYFVWMTINKAAEFYGTVPFSFYWQ